MRAIQPSALIFTRRGALLPRGDRTGLVGPWSQGGSLRRLGDVHVLCGEASSAQFEGAVDTGIPPVQGAGPWPLTRLAPASHAETRSTTESE